jgi:hypothetical protein
LFYVVIILFRQLNSKEVITAVFDIAGYTYGPLLGLYTFGIFSNRPVVDRFVPWICLASPVLTYIINQNSAAWFGGYQFGFERLLLNGLITTLGLWAVSRSVKHPEPVVVS